MAVHFKWDLRNPFFLVLGMITGLILIIIVNHLTLEATMWLIAYILAIIITFAFFLAIVAVIWNTVRYIWWRLKR
jgi:phosphate starvation-inducible membrane PsiE